MPPINDITIFLTKGSNIKWLKMHLYRFNAQFHIFIINKCYNRRYEQGLEDYDEEQNRIQTNRRGKGMYSDSDYDDDHNYVLKDHDHHPEPVTEKEEMHSEEKAVKADPWQGYYDFIITEGSFKFWAAFQVSTDDHPEH